MILGKEKTRKIKTATHPRLLETALRHLQQNDMHLFKHDGCQSHFTHVSLLLVTKSAETELKMKLGSCFKQINF
jgi:hypothetical protein